MVGKKQRFFVDESEWIPELTKKQAFYSRPIKKLIAALERNEVPVSIGNSDKEITHIVGTRWRDYKVPFLAKLPGLTIDKGYTLRDPDSTYEIKVTQRSKLTQFGHVPDGIDCTFVTEREDRAKIFEKLEQVVRNHYGPKNN